MKYYKECDIRGARFNTISTPYSQGWNNGIDSILENATPIEIPTWIPVKIRPCTDEEYKDFQETYGAIPREDCYFFDCLMPDDGQEILTCSKHGGYIRLDCAVNDPDYGWELENDDWDDIAAWMPLPEPYKE